MNAEAKKFLKINWYVQGFNATPNLISHGYLSAISGMHNKLGYGYKVMINSFKNDYCEFYYDWEDYKRVESIVMTKLKENPNYLEELYNETKELWKGQVAFMNQLRAKDLSKLSREELLKLYQEMFVWYVKPVEIAHLLESFILLDEKIKKKLHEYYSKEKRKDSFGHYFSKLNQPIRSSFINEEQISLLKIIKLMKDKDLLEKFKKGEPVEDLDFESVIKKHLEEFFWVKCNYAHGNALKKEDVLLELKVMLKNSLDPDEELEKEKKIYEKNIEVKKQIISELEIKDEELLQALKISEIMLHWQDDRKKYMLMGVTTIDELLTEIALRYGFNKRDLLYLNSREITHEFLSQITTSDLQKRKEGCAFLWELTGKEQGSYDVNTILLVEDDYKEFEREVNKGQDELLDDLRGFCASTGTAIGKVRICRTKEELEDFEEGEILVTSMTRPEFMPAMKKAVAIVTDEGGITSHAAIVSRELKKPCVLGTKVATKILNNGDLVEVRANHGLIVVIEKADN